MFDDRKRVQVEHTYAHALGVVAFCFAQCEWNAVWAAEKLQPGYINSVETKKKTAGVIAGDLVNLVNKIKDKALAARCAPPAADFQRLVRTRNDILHGKPITSSNGDQILAKDAQEWTVRDLEAFADDVTACSILLNDLHHNHLK